MKIRSVLACAVLLLRIPLSLTAFEADSNARYQLGPGDELTIHVSNIAELNGSRAYRVDPQGDLDIPLVGRFHVGGRSLVQVKSDMETSLKEYVYVPDVSLELSQFRSQPVSILGAVGEPGVHQLEGQKTLLEVLSMAKGLRTDAGDSLYLTRTLTSGPIPISRSHLDPAGKFFTAEVNLKALLDAKTPENNIVVKPNDVITVPIAELIYVVGAVARPGGFVLNQRKNMSVLQALSLAGGLAKAASAQKARILHPASESKPMQTALNVKDILRGKSDDIKLNASDILFIPDSATKAALGKVTEAALQAATGAAIYRPW